MKKGVAILMTAIMLLTGIQPVLSLHLCAGTLYSVEFYEEIASSRCCESATEVATPASSAANQSAAGSSSDIMALQAECCVFQTIDISTDDFNRDAAQQSIHNPTQLTGATWAVVTSLLYRIIPDNSLIIRHHFPPVGLSRLTTDLLSYICSYRI